MPLFRPFSTLEVFCLNTGEVETVSAINCEPKSALVTQVCCQKNWSVMAPIVIPGVRPGCLVMLKPDGANFVADFFLPNQHRAFARIGVGLHPMTGRHVWSAPHHMAYAMGKIVTRQGNTPRGPFVLWAINPDRAARWGDAQWFMEFVRDIPRLWLKHVAKEHPEFGPTDPDDEPEPFAGFK